MQIPQLVLEECDQGEVQLMPNLEPLYCEFGASISAPTVLMTCPKCHHTSCVRRDVSLERWENPKKPVPVGENRYALVAAFKVPESVKCANCGGEVIA